MPTLYQNAVEEYIEPVSAVSEDKFARVMTGIVKNPLAIPPRYPEKDFLKETLITTFMYVVFIIIAILGKMALDLLALAIYGHHTPPDSVGLFIITISRGLIIVNTALFIVHLVNASKKAIANS